MKTVVVFLIIMGTSLTAISQGTDCSSAISLTLNGSTTNHSTSSSTGGNVLCTNNGTTPVTWFRFTTNASAEPPLLNITAADGQPCEIAMYTSCSGNMNNNFESTSSMCFEDGTGLWAPAHNYALTANTTYYLRIKTATSTNLQIVAQNHTPVNNSCNGATPIDGNGMTDNNANHKPGQGIIPSELCASSIENTAYYQYYVATTGTSVINISNISCDNGTLNNIAAFQIGFFTGTCSSLTWLNSCFSGSGSFVQATTPVLNAGTKVYVAIDGFEGSNCQYSIQAVNAFILSEDIQNLSGWKNKSSNLIKWKSLNVTSKYFEIERSVDGSTFTILGRINNNVPDKKENDYEFEDAKPSQKTWYRIKQVMDNGKVRFSKTLQLTRQELPHQKLYFTVTPSLLNIEFNSEFEGRSELMIINYYGQQMLQKIVYCKKGLNQLNSNISSLPAGNYLMVLKNKNQKISDSFTKM